VPFHHLPSSLPATLVNGGLSYRIGLSYRVGLCEDLPYHISAQDDTHDLSQLARGEGGSAIPDDKVEGKVEGKVDDDWERDPVHPRNWVRPEMASNYSRQLPSMRSYHQSEFLIPQFHARSRCILLLRR